MPVAPTYVYFSLSSPTDGRYEQDEEYHRTGTIQSLQGQGQEFIVAMICAHLEGKGGRGKRVKRESNDNQLILDYHIP